MAFGIQHGRAWFAIAFLATALYLNGIFHPFIRYDDGLIVHNPAISGWLSLSGIAQTFFDLSLPTRTEHGGEYLPVRDLSAALQSRIFGDHPAPYHLVAILLYALVAITLFETLLSLSVAFGTAFLATLLFTAHPVHVESVTWLSGHKDLLSLLFFLLCLKSYADRRPGRSIVSYLLGIGSKYTTLVAPVFLPAVDWSKRRPLSWRLLSVILVLGIGVYQLIGHVASSVSYPHLAITGGWLDWLRNLPVVLDTAFSRLLVPLHLRLFYTFKPADHWFDPRFLRGTAEFLLLLLLAVRFGRTLSWLPFAAGLFLLNLAPMFRAPTYCFLADRYLLLSSVGFVLLLAEGLLRIPYRATRFCLIALFLVGYSLATIAQNRVWASDQALWENAARAEPPVHPIVWNNLAAIYYQQENWAGAIRADEHCLASLPLKDPSRLPFLLSSGYSRARLGDFKGAEQDYLEALQIDPGNTAIKKNLQAARRFLAKKGNPGASL
ncbi:MAG: tetratricopeptide repeat protein [Pseudomonadota bacterium]